MLDVLLPQRCTVCGTTGPPLCPACERALVRLVPPLCERCGSPGAWPVRRCAECAGRRLGFATARAAIVYDERARRFVGSWKEQGQRRLASLAAELVVEIVPPPCVDTVTFVPADPERGLKRGYAPAARLAGELGDRWQLPVLPLLRRTRSLPRQRGLPLAARRRNVAGAFAPAEAAPRRVCLVDDVYTSGATVAACSTELRRVGARRVEVVSFARAVR